MLGLILINPGTLLFNVENKSKTNNGITDKNQIFNKISDLKEPENKK